MSNVIDLLEKLGSDPLLRHASDAVLEQALLEACVDPAIREALMTRDQHKLETLLGATANVCCMIATPAQEEDDDDDQPSKDDDDDHQDGGDEKALRRAS